MATFATSRGIGFQPVLRFVTSGALCGIGFQPFYTPQVHLAIEPIKCD